MKSKIAILMLSFIGTAAMVSCSGNQAKNEQSTNSDSTSITETAVAGIYQCPMKCEGDKTYDKPGQCPVCKMDLVKIEAPTVTDTTKKAEPGHEGHNHEGHDHGGHDHEGHSH